MQPSPAPRFSNTPAAACKPVREAASDTHALLVELGYDNEAISSLLEGAAQQANV